MMRAARNLAILALIALTAGCTEMWSELYGEFTGTRSGTSSSLVDFLYPDGRVPPPAEQQIPNLQLPLTVGLAFVPSSAALTQGLTEAHKAQLLEGVRERFDSYDFIREITIVPDTYMRSKGGFGTVEQIARLYGLDVMALVSYDQVSFSSDKISAITYWTVIGAYVVKGTKHDVQTFVDTAVFDVESKKLLFRAPGTSVVQTSSTLIDSQGRARSAREQGFDEAVAAMTDNLDIELNRFRERVKEKKENVEISYRPGYGSGASDWIFVLLAALAGFTLAAPRTARRSSQGCLRAIAGLLRRAPFTLAVAAALLLAFLVAGPAPHALVFDRSAIAGDELWRLLSAHLVHSDGGHLAWNLGALLVIGLAFEPAMGRRSMAAATLAGAAAVSAWLWWGSPSTEVYCGLSGVLNAILTAALLAEWRGGRKRVAAIALALCALKIAIEAGAGAAIFTHTLWPALPSAHAAGMLAGALSMLIVHAPARPGPGRSATIERIGPVASQKTEIANACGASA